MIINSNINQDKVMIGGSVLGILIYCWRALARQLSILYNARSRQNLSDVRLKTCAVDCVFISGDSGVLVNARGNIDRFRAIVQLSLKSRTRLINEGL